MKWLIEDTEMKWFIHALKKTFTYKGRARRAEFGWFYLTNFLLGLAFMFIVMLFIWGGFLIGELLRLRDNEIDDVIIYTVVVLQILYSLFNIVVFFSAMSLTTRRLHDLGFSGWWQLLIYLGLPIAMLLGIIPFLPESDNGYLTEAERITFTIGMFLVLGTGGLVSLIFFGLLFFKDGQRKTNKYGEDPKAIPSNETTPTLTIEKTAE